MIKIEKRFVPLHIANLRKSNGVNSRTYITIHETANERKGANAEMHARLQSSGNSRMASWHYQVDDKQAIQSFPHTARCWHAGDRTGNNMSIGIEVCVNEDGDFKQAVKNAADLVRNIMKEENIPLRNVVQHNRWSGKDCPRYLRNGRKGISWHQFISMVDGVEVEQVSNSKTTATVSQPSTSTRAAKLAVDGYLGPLTVRALQRHFGTKVDGVISGQYRNNSNRHIPSIQFGTSGSLLVKAMQKWLGVTQDGFLGPITVRALQRKLGTTVDGVVSSPSLMVMELQKRLNNGTL